MRAVAAQFQEVIALARALLDGCQCERSCYKCLRTYRNQFEHKHLDKRLIAFYLDNLIVINSAAEQARLTAYGADTQRYFGGNPSLWLQRRIRSLGGDLVAICDRVDSGNVAQGAPWGEFLASYVKDHPDRQVHIGLTHVPSLDILNEENLLAVKGLLDLLDAGVFLHHVPEPAANVWHLAAGNGEAKLVVAALDEVLSLSTRLNRQAIIYNDAPTLTEAALAHLRSIVQAGRPITPTAFRALDTNSFRVREIADREPDVTYRELFGEYLAGASWIKIIDPYIRQAYQVANLEVFLNQMPLAKPCRVELITMYADYPRYGASGESESRQRLDQLKQKLTSTGSIQFSYQFDSTIHDRLIQTTDWQIILGRGLDIYYPPDNGERSARQCNIVYLRR